MSGGAPRPAMPRGWDGVDVDPGPEPDDGLLLPEEQPCMGSTLGLPACGLPAEVRNVRVRVSPCGVARIVRDVPVCQPCSNRLQSRLHSDLGVVCGTVSVPLDVDIDSDGAYGLAMREHLVRTVMEV